MNNVDMAIQMRKWMLRRELLLLSQLLNRNLRYAVDFLRKKQYNITEQSLLPLRIVTTPFIDVPKTMLIYATVYCKQQPRFSAFEKISSVYTRHGKDGQNVIYLRGLAIPATYFDMARTLTHELTHVIQHHENRVKEVTTYRDYFENYMSNECEKEALKNDHAVYMALKGDKSKGSELSRFFGKIQLTQVLFGQIYMFEVTPNGVVSTWDDKLVPDDRHKQRNKSNEQRDTDKKVDCQH